MKISLLLPAAMVALAAAPLLAADVSPGAPAPGWHLQSPAGKAVQLSDFKGKVVVLDFWATWCPPCRAEIPDFIALQKQYGDKGLVIVGVSLDQGGPDIVTKFMQAHGMDYPVVMGTEQVTDDYGGIQGIPTTFIIDRQGKIVSSYMGKTEKSVFEGEIKKLL